MHTKLHALPIPTGVVHCLAKAVHSLARIRSAYCVSVIPSVNVCLVRNLTPTGISLVKVYVQCTVECRINNPIFDGLPTDYKICYFVSVFAFTLCETQLSAEDRSFMPGN